MRPIRSLSIYLLIVFVGGALLAPWLYFLVQNLAEQFPAFQKLARNPFHRFVNRSLLVLAILGLWPLVRALGLSSWKDLGLALTRGWWRNLLAGILLGLLSLAVVATGSVLFGSRIINMDRTAADIGRLLMGATLTAVVVGILEEVIFRGAVFGGIRKAHSWIVALVFSSGIYALVHFFSRPQPLETVNAATGFVMLGKMMRGFVDVPVLVPGFFNLALAGMILALAYRLTGNLYFSIGLHAGWIFWLKSYAFFTIARAENWVWGTVKLIDGWAAFVVLLLTFLALLRWQRITQKAAQTA